MRRGKGGNSLLRMSVCHFTGCLRNIKRKGSSPSTFDMWTSLEVFELLDTQGSRQMISYARAVKVFYLWFSACVQQIPSQLVKCDEKLVTDIMQQAMHVKFS